MGPYKLSQQIGARDYDHRGTYNNHGAMKNYIDQVDQHKIDEY